MASWWPIDTEEQRGQRCEQCGGVRGLSRDAEGRVYCPEHRHLHGD